MMQGKNKQGKRTEGVPLANQTSMLSDLYLNLESKQARRNLMMITHAIGACNCRTVLLKSRI